ncbi:MAG: HRDC domain-containing protein [Bacteroidetes bacterium]|nr:HRDC domain-containing protein [Bacteroidota bacterium]
MNGRAFFASHPLKITNKKSARFVDKIFEEINEQIFLAKQNRLMCLRFSIKRTCNLERALPANIEKIKTTYLSSPEEEFEENKLDLFKLLVSYRDEIAEEEDLPSYTIFSNYAIRNCCALLPGDEASSSAVGGFGKTKAAEYGEAVLKIIRNYCEEHSIELNYVKEKKKPKIKTHFQKVRQFIGNSK